jgi:UDP-N-acetylmuramate dehydrogenase
MMAVLRQTDLRGELLHDVSLARYTSWRAGGPARQLYRPADAEDLALFLARLPEAEPLLWLGLGSNLLVRDGGFDGTVIATQGCLDGLEQTAASVVRAEAGVSCNKLARFCARLGLAGAEFLAGIPGTLGGALAMNAGAHGSETWDLVQAVETVDRSGEIHRRLPAEFEVAYRQVRGVEGEWYIAAELGLEAGEPAAINARIKALIDKRNASQPIGQASCGSVFRNPEGDYAARLIEQCGLKGHCIGGACVSEKHANFIVNQANASAADIEALIGHVATVVEQQTGVCLQREAHIVGERKVAETRGGA